MGHHKHTSQLHIDTAMLALRRITILLLLVVFSISAITPSTSTTCGFAQARGEGNRWSWRSSCQKAGCTSGRTCCKAGPGNRWFGCTVGGFKKGDRVQWTGSDDDVPEGTVLVQVSSRRRASDSVVSIAEGFADIFHKAEAETETLVEDLLVGPD